MMIKLFELFFSKEFFLFFLVGAVATLVDWTSVYILTSVVGVWYVFSVLVGYAGGLTTSYAFNRKYTFHNSNEKIKKQFFIFWIISLVGLGITGIIVIFFVEVLLWWYMYAKILASGVALIWHFVGHKFITFRTDVLQ